MSAPAPSNRPLLDALARHYGPVLRRYFAKRVGDQADSEDLVQEVFLRLARRGGIESIEHIEGYLFETAASVLKDRYRRQTSRHARAHDSYDESLHAAEDFSPERVHLGREALNGLVLAIGELPERTRTAFLLHRFEGLRYREIARRLGISTSAVEKHMMIAIAALARRFGQDQ